MPEDTEQLKPPIDILVGSATVSDLDTVTDFMQPAYADTYPNDRGIRRDMFENDTFRNHLREYLEKDLSNPNALLLTANTPEGVVGTIGLRFDEHDPSVAEMWGFYVSPDLQSQGIGGQLWEALNKTERLQRVKKLHLTVAKDSDKAIEFYKSHGFEVTGEEEWDWPSWTDEHPKNQYWKMEKALQTIDEIDPTQTA